jgi:cysteine-rich repeat protein
MDLMRSAFSTFSSTTMLLVVCISIGASSASGQTTRLAYKNGDGEWVWSDVSPGASMLAAKNAASTETVAGTFTITYRDLEDGEGIGFADPELGPERRATMRAVLSYLASVLDVPGTADLVVMSSQTDGGGALASAGPFLVPESGFQGGLVYEHLLTGVDPVRNAMDGTVTVDFGFTWNSDLSAPEPGEQDLYTTLLHEVTHALGLLSVAAPDGRSAVFNSGDRGLFSIYDSFLLRRSTDSRLFLEGGEVNAMSDDLASGDVVFAGERARAALGVYPRVFAPSPFIEGSSIGHWSTANGFRSVMLPALPPGARRRNYRTWELQALADLGYDVVVCGDAFIAGGEECDDGDLEDGDGCSSACRIDASTSPDGGVPDGSPSPFEPEPGAPDELPAHSTSLDSGSGCSVAQGSNDGLCSILLGLSALWIRRRRRDRS